MIHNRLTMTTKVMTEWGEVDKTRNPYRI